MPSVNTKQQQHSFYAYEKDIYHVVPFCHDGCPPLSEDAEQEVIYDLSGRRVLSPKKNGIYVSNGRAILVQ